MTRVAFHFNVADKLLYCCRLSRKALAGGARLWISAPADTVHRLDALMWTFSPLDFVPHCVAPATGVQAHTPVVLSVDAAADAEAAGRVLINLGPQVPTDYASYLRVIDMVGFDEADRAQARQRWKFYAQQGATIERHDVQPSS
jgi:DNA polymerase-3 subunit chi